MVDTAIDTTGSDPQERPNPPRRLTRRQLLYGVMWAVAGVAVFDKFRRKWLANRKRRQAAMIERLGGRIATNYREVIEDAKRTALFDVSAPPPDLSASNLFIGLGNTQVTDIDLALFKGLSNLTHLDLSNTQISDDGLRHLGQLPNLKVLFLSHTGVTDDGISRLAKELPNCRIDR